MLPKVGSRTAAPRRLVPIRKLLRWILNKDARLVASRPVNGFLFHRLLWTIGPVPTGLRDAGFTPTREKTFERLAMTGTSVPETVFQECANWRTLPTTFCDDSTERLVDDFADFGEHTSLR